MKLRKFQQVFIANAVRQGINIAALSLPRGNGKSALAGHLGARIMTPGDALFRSGTESVIVAGSLEQARIIFRFVRDTIGQDRPEYRFAAIPSLAFRLSTSLPGLCYRYGRATPRAPWVSLTPRGSLPTNQAPGG